METADLSMLFLDKLRLLASECSAHPSSEPFKSTSSLIATAMVPKVEPARLVLTEPPLELSELDLALHPPPLELLLETELLPSRR